MSRTVSWTVPSNLGFGVSVLPSTAMFAPSRAARRAMARPMPRLAPVINNVFPARFSGEVRVPVVILAEHGITAWLRFVPKTADARQRLTSISRRVICCAVQNGARIFHQHLHPRLQLHVF